MLKRQLALYIENYINRFFQTRTILRVPTDLGFEQINIGNSVFYDTVRFDIIWKLNNVFRKTSDWCLARRILLKYIFYRAKIVCYR